MALVYHSYIERMDQNGDNTEYDFIPPINMKITSKVLRYVMKQRALVAVFCCAKILPSVIRRLIWKGEESKPVTGKMMRS